MTQEWGSRLVELQRTKTSWSHDRATAMSRMTRLTLLHHRPDAVGRRAVFPDQPDQVADRDPQLVAPVGELALVIDVDLAGIPRSPVADTAWHDLVIRPV